MLVIFFQIIIIKTSIKVSIFHLIKSLFQLEMEKKLTASLNK